MSISLPGHPILIPKILHWVWVGPAPLPREDGEWVKSWLSHHTSWHPILWADSPETLGENVPAGVEVRRIPVLANQKWYDGIERWVSGKAKWASRSDIVRYEVVARYGGVYVDGDVLCVRPIDDLLSSVSLMYAEEWGPRVGNFMLGATPNHPAMWKVVRELGPHLESHKKPINAVIATGPEYFCPRVWPHPDLVIYPARLFSPLCAFDDWKQVKRLPPESYGCHMFRGAWYHRPDRRTPPLEFL